MGTPESETRVKRLIKRQSSPTLFGLLLVAFFASACQPILETPLDAQMPGHVQTLAVQTISADQVLSAYLSTATAIPPPQSTPAAEFINQPLAGPTALPTYTPFPTMGATAFPMQVETANPANATAMASGETNPRGENGKLCNAVEYIQDVTIPDDMEIKPGEKFTKIWQVKNAGNCTWTPDYALVLVWGEPMGVAPPVPIQKLVRPGEVTELRLDMKAPYIPACWQGNWMLTDERGNRFGTGTNALGFVWVSVTVTHPILKKFIRTG